MTHQVFFDQAVAELGGEITLHDLHGVVELLRQRYSNNAIFELASVEPDGVVDVQHLRITPKRPAP